MNYKYWLCIEPTVFIFKGISEALFYDSATSKRIIISLELPLLNDIIDSLQDIENMYCIPISSKMLEEKYLLKVLNLLRDNYMGDFYPIEMQRPVIIPPVMKCHSANKVWTIEKSFIPLLNELTFYVNGECKQSCQYCAGYYQQFLCCCKSKNELNFDKIKDIIERVMPTIKNLKLNFIGGNIALYTQFDSLLSYLKYKELNGNLYFHYKNITDAILKSILSTSIMLHIYIELPLDKSIFLNLLSKLKMYDKQVELVYIITNQKEINEVIELMNFYRYSYYSFKPFYNNRNIDFFEKYIYTTKKDLEDIKLTKIELYRRQYVNMNYVGKLIISSNGHYYVTMQKPSIGSITEDISSVIEREWTNGYLWKYRRDQEPCSKCIYHALCPSPSDYEFAIGKMNLCSII